jgi:hypothetical protein
MSDQVPLDVGRQRLLPLQQGLYAIFSEHSLSARIRRLNFSNLSVFAHHDEFARSGELTFYLLDVLGDRGL